MPRGTTAVATEEETRTPTEDQLAARYEQGELDPNDIGEAPVNIAGAQVSHSLAPSTPGVFVDREKFVVLASRLGRVAEALPKKNPNDPTEQTQYGVPEAFERGDEITKADLWEDPTGKIDNIARLLRTGAIGYYDHPDAIGAIQGLKYRREQEASMMRDRGIISQ